MDIKIVTDSGCDVSQELKKKMNIEVAPLTLQLEDREYIDDETLNIEEYIKNMAICRTAPKTACPSPKDYMQKYEGEESVFVVPLSSKLSGSYNSAVLAKNLFLEEVNNKFIHVFDSVTASIGQTIIALKINELSKLNLGNVEIVEKINKYISEMKTFFLLQNLDHLAKAGRLNPIIAKVANMLSIKPIMGSNDDGSIRMVEKTRGYKKALKRFIEIIGEEGTNLEQKVLGIAHCNCLERALKFKEEVLERYKFKDVIVIEMAGLSTTYADDGGLVIAF